MYHLFLCSIFLTDFGTPFLFLSDPGKPGVRSMGPDVCLSVRLTPFWNLTDVTLADEDTNSILTDNVKRAIQGNVAMQVTEVAPSCGQIWN